MPRWTDKSMKCKTCVSILQNIFQRIFFSIYYINRGSFKPFSFKNYFPTTTTLITRKTKNSYFSPTNFLFSEKFSQEKAHYEESFAGSPTRVSISRIKRSENIRATCSWRFYLPRTLGSFAKQQAPTIPSIYVDDSFPGARISPTRSCLP